MGASNDWRHTPKTPEQVQDFRSVANGCSTEILENMLHLPGAVREYRQAIEEILAERRGQVSDNLHEKTMAVLATRSKDVLLRVCTAMAVEPCRADTVDDLLEALSDASWDGAHGTSEEFDQRLAALLELQ